MSPHTEISPKWLILPLVLSLLVIGYGLQQPNLDGPGANLAQISSRNGSAVSAFRLYDAGTDAVVDSNLTTGEVINLAEVGSRLNIEAVGLGTIGSVRFWHDRTPSESHSRNENSAPYTLCGDSGSDVYDCDPSLFSLGQHTLTAIPYSGSNGGGTVGQALSINFTVINKGSPRGLIPVVDLRASVNDQTVDSVDLTWTTEHVNVCAATGGWSGLRPVNGNETVNNVPAGPNIFSLSCTGQGKVTTDSEMVDVNPTPACGNGIIDTFLGEQCDSLNLGGQTCAGLGYTGGTLSCYPAGTTNPPNSQCTFNTGQCTQNPTGAAFRTITLDLPLTGSPICENSTPNPFYDYRLDVTFTNGSRSITVPGYFAADGTAIDDLDGSNSCGNTTVGNIWRVHFVPNAAGQWNYRAILYRGDAVAVASNPAGATQVFNRTGTVNAVSATGELGFLSKGPLRYVDGHYLRFDNGEYFLKSGIGSPENFLAYRGTAGSLGFPDGGRHTYVNHGGIRGAIDYLSSQGMNSVYMLTMNVAGDTGEVWPWIDGGTQGYGSISRNGFPSTSQKSGMLRFDVSKLDKWNDLFGYMDQKGMMKHFILTETENETFFEGTNSGFDNTRKLYYREVVARFGHHRALAYNIGEENGGSSGNSDTQRKAFADYLALLDPYDKHIAVHTANGEADRQAIYTPLLGYSSLTGPSLQIDIGEIAGDIARWRSGSGAAGHPWVITMDEIGPASHQHSADTLRRSVIWPVLMLGGAGFDHYFHAGGNLDWILGTNPAFTAKQDVWQYSSRAVQFFQNYLPFTRMTSQNSLTSASNDYVFALTGDAYAIYLPSGGTTNLTLPGSSTDRYTVRWYDPRNGGALQTGSVSEVLGGGSRAIGNPPSSTSSDWAALVRRN